MSELSVALMNIYTCIMAIIYGMDMKSRLGETFYGLAHKNYSSEHKTNIYSKQ